MHYLITALRVLQAASKVRRREQSAPSLEQSLPSLEPPPQEQLLAFLHRALAQFNPMRKLARDTMWHSMSSLLLAVVARVANSAMGKLDDPWTMLGALLASGVFLIAILSVHFTVHTFRAAYRPFLAEQGHSW